MNFDLNTAAGFSAITGGVGSLLTSLTGAIQQNWDIDESSYGHPADSTKILFHVFKTSTDFNAAVDQVQDTEGRRKVPIVFPYVDGQSTDDLGRKGEVFDFNVLIFGPNYKAQYQKLLLELNKPEPGTLIHPVRGPITVVAEDWTVTHASGAKQAVALKIRFIEHSFSVSFTQIPIKKNISSALTDALGFVSKIDGIINKAQALVFVALGTKALVTSVIQGYVALYQSLLGSMNQAFNGGSASIPAFQPTVAGQDPTLFSVASVPGDVFTGTGALQQQQAVQALTAAQASQQAITQMKALRTTLSSQIAQIEATEGGQGALIFHDDILTLKQSAEALQTVLEVGLKTSSHQIVSYMTPRDMSAREVAFANGLTPDSAIDIETLNPGLLSLNLIPQGTVVKVPT